MTRFRPFAFVDRLRRIPMAVRFKFDRGGIKLTLPGAPLCRAGASGRRGPRGGHGFASARRRQAREGTPQPGFTPFRKTPRPAAIWRVNAMVVTTWLACLASPAYANRSQSLPASWQGFTAQDALQVITAGVLMLLTLWLQRPMHWIGRKLRDAGRRARQDRGTWAGTPPDP